MPDKFSIAIAIAIALLALNDVAAAELPPLSSNLVVAAEEDYQRYCALCHGDERQGYVNDHAPSLRSKSLLTSGEHEMFYTVAYGRFGTAMAGFLNEVGGPMRSSEIHILMRWLRSQVTVDPFEFTFEAVTGDADTGKTIYARECAACHGANGEGDIGTALGNPAMLSLTSDRFLRYAIEHGRDGTEMPAFGGKLSAAEIDAVTAFLRSRSTGWAVKKAVLRAPPTADHYVLNPDSPAAEFDLKDGLYVMSADLRKALQDKRRIVLLDTRPMSQWQMVNIEGSVPVPYYYGYGDLGKLAKDLPHDGTTIVTYCQCPRAEAEYVNKKLWELGFTNTAVLWEGIRGWVSLGYPVARGETTMVDPGDVH